MRDSEVLTRRGMLVLLGGGGAAAGVAMIGVNGPAMKTTAIDTTAVVPPVRGGPRLVAAVTHATRRRRPGRAGAAHGAHAPVVTHATAPTTGTADGAATGDQLWPDVVRVDLRVENVTEQPVLLSPGQFRLRALGVTIAPLAAQRAVAAVAAREVVDAWIEYLAPAEAGELALDYTDFGRLHAVRLPFVPAEEAAP